MPLDSETPKSRRKTARQAKQAPADAAPRPDAADEGFATVREAATFLRLSLPFVYKLMASGQLPHARFGRSVRIPWTGLRAFAEKAITQANANRLFT